MLDKIFKRVGSLMIAFFVFSLFILFTLAAVYFSLTVYFDIMELIQ